jgi:hypothetical protein
MSKPGVNSKDLSFPSYPCSDHSFLQGYSLELLLTIQSATRASIKWLSGQMPVCTEARSFSLQVWNKWSLICIYEKCSWCHVGFWTTQRRIAIAVCIISLQCLKHSSRRPLPVACQTGVQHSSRIVGPSSWFRQFRYAHFEDWLSKAMEMAHRNTNDKLQRRVIENRTWEIVLIFKARW